MKYSGSIAGELSGSLGGITASRNRGGPFLRMRVTPTNPNTALQSIIRTITQYLAVAWANSLTQDQRDAWDNWNLQTPGFPGTGIDAYVRCNLPRMYCDEVFASTLGVFDDPPLTFDVGSFTPIAITTIDASASQITFTFENTDTWAILDGGGLFIYASPPVNGSRKNYFGKYNLLGVVPGDTTTPPTSPKVISTPFTAVVGQRVFVKVRATQADGRLSAIQRLSALVTA